MPDKLFFREQGELMAEGGSSDALAITMGHLGSALTTAGELGQAKATLKVRRGEGPVCFLSGSVRRP